MFSPLKKIPETKFFKEGVSHRNQSQIYLLHTYHTEKISSYFVPVPVVRLGTKELVISYARDDEPD